MIYKVPSSPPNDATHENDRPEDGKDLHSYGFRPDFRERFKRTFSSFLVRILGLNGCSHFSNVFLQMIDPVADVIWKKSNRKLSFRTGHGRLLWRVKTFYTEEPMMIRWLESFNENDVFLDIGANVGTYTIPGAIEAKMTYACELDPMNVSLLKENIFLNDLHSKVVILPFAAGRTTEVIDVFYRDFSRGDALQSIGRESPFNTVTGEGKHVSKQFAFPLNQIFEQFKLEHPTRVKIDVDGNEAFLFEGGFDVISKAHEIYFEDSGLQECKPIIERILNAGFEISEQEVPVDDDLGLNILFRRSEHSK